MLKFSCYFHFPISHISHFLGYINISQKGTTSYFSLFKRLSDIFVLHVKMSLKFYQQKYITFLLQTYCI